MSFSLLSYSHTPIVEANFWFDYFVCQFCETHYFSTQYTLIMVKCLLLNISVCVICILLILACLPPHFYILALMDALLKNFVIKLVQILLSFLINTNKSNCDVYMLLLLFLSYSKAWTFIVLSSGLVLNAITQLSIP